MKPTSISSLPEEGFVRLKQLIGDPKADPPIPAIIPVKRATIYNWIKEGRFPKPKKLGLRVSVWHVEDIRAFIASETAECLEPGYGHTTYVSHTSRT